MAEALKLFPLRGLPGIKRDGTDTEGNYWSDGRWVRFYRGLPRSIGGYRAMTETFPGPSRGLFVNSIGNGFISVFSGTSDALNVGQFTTAGIGSTPTDITPVGFPSNANNIWQLDSFYNSNGGGEISIIGHAAPNLVDIGSTDTAPVYYGNIDATIPLVASQKQAGGDFVIDGGIIALHPYLVAFGSPGLVAWSAVNDPTTFPTANAANPVSSKIVKGISIRGGSTNPSCLLWSLDSVIQMSFVGGSAIWDFNTLSDQSSILSSSCVVEMDGIYYWIGIDRYLTFNGVLKELLNQMNLDFFFGNLNFSQRQKVFGFKIPRWGEICWCAPLFGATECNWMFIYNVREGTWYDTPLPVDGRSAAYFAQTFPYPIMTSANGLTPIGQNTGLNYPLWQHEVGVNQIRGNVVDAIPSNIISPSLSFVGGGLTAVGNPAAAPDDVWTELAYLEPDFNFGQNLNFTVLGREYPQDEESILIQKTIMKQPSNNKFDLQVQARYLRWMIGANEQNGYFQMGQPLISYRPGDKSR